MHTLSYQTRQKLRTLLDRQGGKCAICGDPLRLSSANLDHIVPRSLGGCKSLWNLRATHVECNSARKNAPEDSNAYRGALNRHRAEGRNFPGATYHSERANPPSAALAQR